MTTSISSIKPDYLGAISSTLCLIHCIATPFIFIAHASTHHDHNHASPLWWQGIDIIFLAISFFAVLQTSRNTTKKWVSLGLKVSWGILVLILMNEKVHLLHIPELAIFFPTLGLVGLHIYNLKFCQCKDEDCCSN